MLRSTALLLVVMPASLCMAATIQVPGDYATIQAAIDAAAEGDTVLVAPGEYVITEPITYRGKGITVRGEAGPDVTTIRMAAVPADPNRASVIIFENGETNAAMLEGVKITGGEGTLCIDDGSILGGGACCRDSSPMLFKCVISGNAAEWGYGTGYGGGVYCSGSSPTLTECTIAGNHAIEDGGGIYCESGSSPTLTDCTISSNSAWDGCGGGLYYNSDSSPTLNRCIISGNWASYGGGGVYCAGGVLSTITDCTITNNGGWPGGGVVCGGASSPILTNCIITENETVCKDGDVGGGGVTCYNSSPILINCMISENVMQGTGGYGGGGLYCQNSSPILINCAIIGNTTPALQQGGAGGVVCRSGSCPILTNCTIVRNLASGPGYSSGGLLCEVYSSPILTNCTIAGNTASGELGGAGGVYCTGSSLPTLANCVVWANYGGSVGGLLEARYSCIQATEVSPGEGNIDVDPRFLGDVDFHLQPGSPCIDAGTSEGAPTTDIEGNTRPCGLAVDMGAYEYCPARELTLTSATIAECAPAHVFVLLTNEQPVQAFSLGVAHDPTVATLAAIDFADCPVIQALNGDQGPEYFIVDIHPGTGHCDAAITAGGTLYCITSQAHPSTMTIPAGADQPIARLTYEAVPGNIIATGSDVTIVGCLGTYLPREVVITIDGLSYTPNLVGGTLTVAPAACRFIRGDANGDRRVDISDVVTLLMYMFENRHGRVRCEDAGDANDDGALDIADPIRILGRLFADGPPFDPPYPGCGTDPTLDILRCSVNQCE